MTVYCYPADSYGCGHHRIVWPFRALNDERYQVVGAENRVISLDIPRGTDQATAVRLPADCEAVVLQRTTNRFMANAVKVMRAEGIAVVIDIDDDLAAIDPNNPAFDALHPRSEGTVGANGEVSHHSWAHLTTACRDATLVTVTTPALLKRYAWHGRGRVIPNYLADHYYGVEHTDSAVIGWPATLVSHPGDPADVGNAIARLVNLDGATFTVTANPTGVARAFGLSGEVEGKWDQTTVDEWPAVVARLGIGIAPLVDTRFNHGKSWLKPLEMSAVGVPWVGSPRAEYQRLHDLGAGWLADSPKQWYRLLRDLVRHESNRLELAERGREAAELLRLRDNAWRWQEAVEDALAIQRGTVPHRVIVT
jgi:hypothetical protein